MNSPSFSLIIPTYNESGNILTLLKRVEDQLRDLDYEIIVVDDHSPDKTYDMVQAYKTTHPRVSLIVRATERGLGSAFLRGLQESHGRIVGIMDADLSHDERLLPALIRAIDQGAELAVGSRRVPGGGADNWPWHRRFLSDIATRLTIAWLKVPLSDPMSGYFVLRRSLYDSCRERLTPQGYKILLEIYCKARPVRVTELPFIFKDRKQGQSKLTWRVMTQFLRMLFQLRGVGAPE